MPLSLNYITDRDGCDFTKMENIQLNFYHVGRVCPYIEKTLQVHGPEVNALKAFCWKVKCPPKMKHFFLWQIVSRYISVKDSLRARGIEGDTQCVL